MKFNLRKIGQGVLLSFFFPLLTWGQQPMTLSDFNSPSKSWKEVNEVWADPTIQNDLYSSGEGSIIINSPDKKNPGKDLISKESFGDIELQMTYMMGLNSNSGLYLLGQYEIQLFDSWEKVSPKAGDNGGIYERWDEFRPEGMKGYGGFAPRQNASKAAGLWQTLEVGFQAPKISPTGEKTQNALVRYVRLNGVTIHENVELQGPTRGALKNSEIPIGPIRIQGDHGPVAIKSLVIKSMDTPKPTLSKLTMEVYPGSISTLSDLETLTPTIKKELTGLNDFSSGIAGSSFAEVNGILSVQRSGNYTLDMEVPRGLGAISVGDEIISKLQPGRIRYETELSEGNHPITFYVSRPRDWSTQGFSLQIQEQSLWPISLSETAGYSQLDSDPIWVNNEATPVLRSFIEMPDKGKISHAISVSSEAGIHFSYDLNSGRLIRVWRGMFLDVTPMWNNRGNGISRPLGNLTYLDRNSKSGPVNGSVEFKPKGYRILGDGNIKFLAEYPLGQISDHIQLLPNGKGLTREILKSDTGSVNLAIAEGNAVKKIRENLYWIEDAGLFIQLTDQSIKPEINEKGQVVLPWQTQLTYTLLF